MHSIAPGGCYPPGWPSPPRCYPPYPPAPEPDPDSLDATVDWMTYPHYELYQMVHSGLNLSDAMAVSAQWARIGEELGELGDELGKIVEAAATAWEGDAADLARDTLASLTNWATDAGTLATKVSGCVSIQVDNTSTARDEMPSPFHILEPGPAPVIRAFTSGAFTDAAAITSDPAGPVGHEKSLHAQAARTMERFQQASREVYGTVPQFSPPRVGARILGPGETPPPNQPTPPQQPQPTPVPPGTPGRAQVGGTPGSPAGGTVGGPAVRAATPPAPGPGVAAGAGEPATQSKPAAASAAPGRSGHPGVTGMPMGGAGARGGEDTERTSSSYLQEDEDIWGVADRHATPGVIGEGKRRA